MADSETLRSRPRFGSRVLLVADAPEARASHSLELAGSGLRLITADTGRRALDAVLQSVPDVIVTDTDAPLADGLDLCRHIRAAPETRRVAVVVVTGDRSEQAHAAALAAGCDVVLTKPYSGALLLTAVRLLLQRR